MKTPDRVALTMDCFLLLCVAKKTGSSVGSVICIFLLRHLARNGDPDAALRLLLEVREEGGRGTASTAAFSTHNFQGCNMMNLKR